MTRTAHLERMFAPARQMLAGADATPEQIDGEKKVFVCGVLSTLTEIRRAADAGPAAVQRFLTELDGELTELRAQANRTTH